MEKVEDRFFHSPISRVRAVFRMISITGFLPEGQSLIFAVLAFESDEAAFCRTSFVFRCCSAGPLNWGRVPSGGRRPDLSFAGVWKENQGNIGRKVVLRFKRKGVRIVRGGSVDFCFMEGNHFFLPDRGTRFANPRVGDLPVLFRKEIQFFGCKIFCFLSPFYFQIRIKVVSYKCSV